MCQGATDQAHHIHELFGKFFRDRFCVLNGRGVEDDLHREKGQVVSNLMGIPQKNGVGRGRVVIAKKRNIGRESNVGLNFPIGEEFRHQIASTRDFEFVRLALTGFFEFLIGVVDRPFHMLAKCCTGVVSAIA